MKTFVRLLSFLKPYKRSSLISVLLASLAMVCTVLIPSLIGSAVDAIKSGDRHHLKVVAILIIAAAVGRLILTIFRRLVAGQVSLAVEYDLRSILYRHLQSLELAFFDAQQTGQLMSRATVDLQGIRFFLGYGLVFITQSILTLLLAGVAMFIINPQLAAIALSPVPFVIFIAFRYGMRARPALQEVQQRIAELTAVAEENISGIRVVKAFAREHEESKRFNSSTDRVFDQSILSTRLRAFYTPLVAFLPSLGLAAVLQFGGNSVIDGGLTTGEFTAFYAYLLMLSGPMRSLGMALGMSQRAVASGERFYQILDRKPQMQVPPDAADLAEGRGTIQYSGVTLTYSGESKPALKDINLTVKPGETVAVVGRAGSGKSTLTALLPRLYDPERGQVTIDGSNVSQVNLESLRSQIAIVNDEPFLFSATVAENIAYGSPQATQEEIEEAARIAEAERFINQLPEGYATEIGERGIRLSGGQRQRIAIARALITKPRILILDNATSSLDAQTERRLRENLKAQLGTLTTLIIAHRLSTISLADRIIVLKDGQIINEGTHDELLKASEFYRMIVEKGQLSNEDEYPEVTE